MRSLLRRWADLQVHTQILAGLVAGVILGLAVGERAVLIKPVGTLFLRLISMVIIPLVFASLILGVASLGDIRKIGRIGSRTIAYYILTTVVAIFLGLSICNLAKPGVGIGDEIKTELMADYQEITEDQIERAREKRPSTVDALLRIVPTNPVASLAQGEMLQVIFFAIFLGIALSRLDDSLSNPMITFFEAINQAMIWAIHVIMMIAPFGVLALIAGIVGSFGLGILLPLMKYFVVVFVGLAIHAFVVYPTILKLTVRGSVVREFFRGIRPAQLLAFSTSSSSATLPVTIDCCTNRLKLPSSIASFVLPLGATVNMDGTALYQGVAAVFIAQVYGLDLTISAQLGILLTATMASIGTAGVPGAGIIMLGLILESAGIPLEGIALILGVDRVLDMMRTTVNVTGDCVATAVVSRLEERREQRSGTP